MSSTVTTPQPKPAPSRHRASARFYRIPARLNLFLAGAQLVILPSLLLLTGLTQIWWQVGILALVYGLVMNSAYVLLHEAEHNILHPNRKLNDTLGVLLALFFPVSYHLIRQGHIGHHWRNRSDDEAFDFYFEGESRVWKYLQLYGILTGCFWIVVVLSNFLAVFLPSSLKPRYDRVDRPTQALMESLNPRYLRWIRLESLAVLLLHSGLIYFAGLPIGPYLLVLFGFGFIWSALQYLHHFNTERDVLKGARNVKTWRWLDALWLNHNLHRNHHSAPTVPWIHLPQITPPDGGETEGMVKNYFRMWRGPRLTRIRVENRYRGRIIR